MSLSGGIQYTSAFSKCEWVLAPGHAKIFYATEREPELANHIQDSSASMKSRTPSPTKYKDNKELLKEHQVYFLNYSKDISSLKLM